MRNKISGFRRSRVLVFGLCGFALAGCGSADQVLFVTNTKVGVGFDASSASGHVGYQRQEAYVGPDYPESGGIPPVAAKLKADLSFSGPSVAQYYATGDAALIATKRIQPFTSVDRSDPKKFTDSREKCALNLGCAHGTRGRRVSVVATNSHVGLEIKAQAGTLSSLDFGYGRQEASVLPLRSGNDGDDIYPSSYASIAVEPSRAANGTIDGLAISQFIATGAAADALASTPEVQSSFAAMAAAAAAQQKSALAASLGMDDTRFQKLQEEGAATAKATTASIDKALAKVLGREAQDNEVLTSAERSKIDGFLPGALIPTADEIATAGSFRKYLNQNDRAAAAFVAQLK